MKRLLSYPSVSFLVVVLFCCACLAGCAGVGEKGGQSAEARQDVYVHLVEWPGETLPMIAQWYTGNKDNGKILSRTSPDIVPDRLEVGDHVLIPLALMKNSTKMPREFFSTFGAKDRPAPKKASPKAKPAPVKQEEFQLYGPK